MNTNKGQICIDTDKKTKLKKGRNKQKVITTMRHIKLSN